MFNIFKAFMYDLRADGFVYAVKSTVREFNPYAQLRDARAWVEDQREIIEALAQDVVQLERDYAALRAEKEEPVILTGNRPEDGASQTAKGLVQSMPWPAVVMLDEWPEGYPDVLKDIRDKLNPLLFKRFEGMNTREVYDALQQDAYERAIMKLSDEEIAVLKTVWKVEG
jgi:hypothetical protein